MLHNNRLAMILAIAASSGLLANDLFLPLLPTVKDLFDVSAAETQLLLIHFLFAMGLTQLFYPALAGVLGKRRALLLGLFIFSVASLALVLAKTFEQLILLRTLQAIGAGLCLALSRVIMRAQMHPEEAHRGFVTMATVMGIMPAAAPMLGFVLNWAFGLKACFVAGAVFSLSTIALISTLKMIRADGESQREQHAESYGCRYVRIAASKEFWRYAIVPCFAYAAYFTYICASPYLLELGNLSVLAIAASYGILSFTYVLGSFFARRLAAHHGVDTALFLGHAFFLAGGLWAGIEFMQSQIVPLRCILAMSLLTLGNGFLLPLGTAATLSTSTSGPTLVPAVLGFFQFCIAAGSAYLSNRLMGRDIAHVGLLIASISMLAFGVCFYGRYFVIQKTVAGVQATR